jgi:hypothetical protein
VRFRLFTGFAASLTVYMQESKVFVADSSGEDWLWGKVNLRLVQELVCTEHCGTDSPEDETNQQQCNQTYSCE